MTVDVHVRVDQQQAAARRPRRQDAARNYDALIAAARKEFDEHGEDAALKAVARRAGVGIATLYRHFPTRSSLIECVFGDELVEVVNGLCREASTPCAGDPGEVLTSWLVRFMRAVSENWALREVFRAESTRLTPCRVALCQVVGRLLDEEQVAIAFRRDVHVDAFLRTVVSIAVSPFVTCQQRDHVLGVLLRGMRI
ncbi:TetR/AcrR family transcriptional regulator [Streptomyces sp. NPDC050788]|uniref:TetR/AcrR family transcriptional regulator n=1 Tax=Streptomyces sp. NPDC050788 TaxID=3155041 RepID=UPI0034303E92